MSRALLTLELDTEDPADSRLLALALGAQARELAGAVAALEDHVLHRLKRGDLGTEAYLELEEVRTRIRAGLGDLAAAVRP